MTPTPYTNALAEAKRMYVAGEISEDKLEAIVEDAIRRKDALESSGKEWERFASDHGMNEIHLLSAYATENMSI